MLQLDDTAKITSYKNDSEIKTIDQFPKTESAYNAFFKVEASQPPARACQIAVYFKVYSVKMIRKFKANNAIFNVLHLHRAWLLADTFESASMACISLIMSHHPMLTWIPNLEQQLETGMKEVDIQRSTERLLPAAVRDEILEGVTYVLDFELVKKKVGFGIADNRIVTETIGVHVERELGPYMKEVLSKASDKNPELGLCVPAGYHIIAGVSSYKQILSDQNEFISEARALPVVGLKIETLDTGVWVQTAKGAVRKSVRQIVADSGLFSGIEQMVRSSDLGKYFLLTTKAFISQARQWIDTSFAKIYEQLDSTMQVAGFQYPHRTSVPSTDSRINALAQKIISSQNPQGDDEIEYHQLPARRKPRRIRFVYDSDFPATQSQGTAATASMLTSDNDTDNKKQGCKTDVTYAEKARGRTSNCKPAKDNELKQCLAKLETTAQEAKKSADESREALKRMLEVQEQMANTQGEMQTFMNSIKDNLSKMVAQAVQRVLTQVGFNTGTPLQPTPSQPLTQERITHVPPPREDEPMSKKSKNVDPQHQDLNHHSRT